MSELKYWIWMSEHIKLKNKSALTLLDAFGSPEAVYFAREEEYSKFPELTQMQRASLADKGMKEVSRILTICAENGWRVMTLDDGAYPQRLKNIYAPPIVLYVRGYLPDMDEEAAVTIVGTRSCTPYGLKTAERIGYEVTRAGGIVVSGLAEGIDTAAARGALRAGGSVVGVIGSGLDVVYPRFNKPLFDDVAAVGAIISEYAPGARPERRHFPERNRILSGISAGVVVVEAPKNSGALITAARALEQGRDVFAVPANVDAVSCEGSNNLLKEGAVPVTSGWDVMETYSAVYPDKVGRASRKDDVPLDGEGEEKLVQIGIKARKERPILIKKEIDKKKPVGYIDLLVKIEDLTSEERDVISVMTEEEMHVDDIIEASGLPAAKVLSLMTLLEIKGAVTQRPGKKFISHISVK